MENIHDFKGQYNNEFLKLIIEEEPSVLPIENVKALRSVLWIYDFRHDAKLMIYGTKARELAIEKGTEFSELKLYHEILKKRSTLPKSTILKPKTNQ